MIGTVTSLWAMAQDVAPKAAAAAEAAVPEPGSEAAIIDHGSFWLPPDAASFTNDIDWLFYGILGLTIFCFIGITFVTVYFSWKYRARPGHEAEPSEAHNDSLEITWTVIPSILCIFIFVWGWQGFVNLNTPPTNAPLEIRVTASKWVWSFYYNDDVPAENVLHVPVNEPVKLVMTSAESGEKVYPVLHSLYVPAFRIKADVIPFRYTYLWFEATKIGTFRLTCAEYCGDQHSAMKTTVVVHEAGDYAKWLEAASNPYVDPKTKKERPLSQVGELFYVKRGCKQCHSADGSSGTGPTFKGSWGEAHKMRDGSTVTFDENYVRESLVEPLAKVRSGFNPVMPTFAGKLSDKDIAAIIEYLKTLK